MVNLWWNYGNHWKKDHRATKNSSLINYGCQDECKSIHALQRLSLITQGELSSWMFICEHFIPTSVNQGCGQAHLHLEECTFDSLISDWITCQNIVWKWLCRLIHMKEDHLVCCECTEVFLWSLFKGKFLLSNNIGMILLNWALSLSICGGYSKNKTTKTHIQQASKTFVMWECSVLRGPRVEANRHKKKGELGMININCPKHILYFSSLFQKLKY